MPDRRADARVAIAHTPALVIDREGQRTFDVTISDFGQDGCSVVSARVLEFPVEVGLQIRGFDDVIQGRVVWRQANKAGIEFAWVDPVAAASAEPASTISIPAMASNLTGGLRIRCTIEDATRTTCRIASDHIDKLNDDIMITINSRKVAISGRIVWRADGCAGVELKWPADGRVPQPDMAESRQFP